MFVWNQFASDLYHVRISLQHCVAAQTREEFMGSKSRRSRASAEINAARGHKLGSRFTEPLQRAADCSKGRRHSKCEICGAMRCRLDERSGGVTLSAITLSQFTCRTRQICSGDGCDLGIEDGLNRVAHRVSLAQ
jgi:hypothetical protein